MGTFLFALKFPLLSVKEDRFYQFYLLHSNVRWKVDCETNLTSWGQIQHHTLAWHKRKEQHLSRPQLHTLNLLADIFFWPNGHLLIFSVSCKSVSALKTPYTLFLLWQLAVLSSQHVIIYFIWSEQLLLVLSSHGRICVFLGFFCKRFSLFLVYCCTHHKHTLQFQINVLHY